MLCIHRSDGDGSSSSSRSSYNNSSNTDDEIFMYTIWCIIISPHANQSTQRDTECVSADNFHLIKNIFAYTDEGNKLLFLDYFVLFEFDAEHYLLE